ncbi:MAG TPA: hypothetical protein PK622_05000 [Saprospiraceae bacterium]|nr:hypothetical protein [Saprospiraceae bacterium]
MNSTKLGLKENWRQFELLVVIDAFVGRMIVLERIEGYKHLPVPKLLYFFNQVLRKYNLKIKIIIDKNRSQKFAK